MRNDHVNRIIIMMKKGAGRISSVVLGRDVGKKMKKHKFIALCIGMCGAALATIALVAKDLTLLGGEVFIMLGALICALSILLYFSDE